MGIYLTSTIVFLAVLLVLVAVLLFLEARVAPAGKRTVTVNGDNGKSLSVPVGVSLLSGLSQNSVYLPSGCGGGGTCGLCKCVIKSGGGEILPTELPHLSRAEKKDNVRLSCQVKVREDMEIEVPPYVLDIKKYRAKVVFNRSVATFIKELTVKIDAPEPIEFKTGGYMQIDIPEYKLAFADLDITEPYHAVWQRDDVFKFAAVNAEPTFRAYSMANYPGEEHFMFTVRVELPPKGTSYPPGVGSSYLFGLKPGDEIALSGPYGDFFIKDTRREMCFIGGGAGMAPLRSHIFDQLKNKNTKRKISFWYGARSRMEMFYDEEFKALAAGFDNFEYHVALSDSLPDDDWEGSKGFIHTVAHDLYLQEHDAPDEIEYYLCGPPLMLKAVLEMLDSLGVEPEMIAYDDFGGVKV